MATGTSTFTGTGPQGHRGRMRGRLLANPGALADYEIVEMLLFLGIPRVDTKPRAKGLLQQFGSLAATLGAIPAHLEGCGLPDGVVGAFGLVCDSAAHLTGAEPAPRPRLGDWAALEAFLDLPGRVRQPPGLVVLLLDSRNQLIAEASWPTDDDWPSLQRNVLREALARHAGAVVVIRNGGCSRPALREDDHARHATLAGAARALSILVHDWMVIGAGEWTSLRKAGGRHTVVR